MKKQIFRLFLLIGILGISVGCLTSCDKDNGEDDNNQPSGPSTDVPDDGSSGGGSTTVPPDDDNGGSNTPEDSTIASIVLGDLRIQLLSDTVVRVENN